MEKELLAKLYLKEKRSVSNIAKQLHCSQHKVNYWLEKHSIPKRSISEAIYLKRNPKGDPFSFSVPKTSAGHFLLGLGLGLYWGEGNKRNKTQVRLGNTDPKLIRVFVRFLQKVYGVKKSKFHFGLQVFSDMSPKQALAFWMKTLNVPRSQFGKVIVTPARGIGTYREKTRHGVLTVYVSNRKLRDLICGEIEKL
jgi:hypothetical protein